MKCDRSLVKGLQSVSMIIPFLLLISSLIAVAIYLSPNSTLGQSSTSGTQSWLDRENNLRIVFSYTPAIPIIDTPTDLKFSIQNLQTGKLVTDLSARVVILTNSSGTERIFRFSNITAPDGVFSIKYLFPDTGLYQVITRITSQSNGVASLASLASFNVFVPGQPNPFSLNNSSGSSNPWIIFVIAVAAVIATILIVINRRKARKWNIRRYPQSTSLASSDKINLHHVDNWKLYELDISRCQQAYNVIGDYFSFVTTILTFYWHFEIIHNRFDWLKEDSFNGYFTLGTMMPGMSNL